MYSRNQYRGDAEKQERLQYEQHKDRFLQQAVEDKTSFTTVYQSKKHTSVTKYNAENGSTFTQEYPTSRPSRISPDALKAANNVAKFLIGTGTAIGGIPDFTLTSSGAGAIIAGGGVALQGIIWICKKCQQKFQQRHERNCDDQYCQRCRP
jgi:hypothetical protein